MNKKKIIELIASSSNKLLLLFCCLFFSSQSYSFSNPIQDTIIIDGKTVVVNRIVEYEDPIPEPEEPEKKKKKKGDYYALVDFWGGITSGKITGSDSKFQTLSEFIDKKSTITQYDFAHLSIGKEFNDQLALELGVGISYFSIGNRYFVESSLHDSLDHFQSFKKGELSQIVVFNYDIGSEVDTVETELVKSNFTQTSLSIPLILRWTSESKKRQKLRFSANLGLIGKYVFANTGGPYVVLEDNNKYVYYSNEDLGLNSLQLIGRIGIGIKTDLSRRAMFVADAHLLMPISNLHSQSDVLQLSYLQTGLSIGLIISFPSY